MKILITGITGFAGSHLVDYILENHPEVKIHGICRWRSPMDNLIMVKEKIVMHECDLRDAHNVEAIINEIKPDKIFHLAAQSFVPTSWTAPSETLETNIIGQCNIFEAVRKIKGYKPVIQIACSSEEYGLVMPEECPIKETNPLRPLSPYAVSKVAQDYMGYQYFKSYGLNIIRTRAFNHSGPRRPEVFVDSGFAKQIIEIRHGLRNELKVGNLEAIRDFTDVRDMVRAYWMATEKCEAGEVYNICSGWGVRIKNMVNVLAEIAKVDVKIKEDKDRMRPSDVPVLIGDCTKFSKVAEWYPKIAYDVTLTDMLNYWETRL